MARTSYTWGLSAFVMTFLAFLPLLSQINWFNLPFSGLGTIFSVFAIARAGTGKELAIIGLVSAGIAFGISIVKLVFGPSTF